MSTRSWSARHRKRRNERNRNRRNARRRKRLRLRRQNVPHKLLKNQWRLKMRKRMRK